MEKKKTILTLEDENEADYSAISGLCELLIKTGKNYDLSKIRRAYLFARDLHSGQYRKSGEEYISHPIAVAELVAGLELDTDSICAALLHDTLEDCGTRVDLAAINESFGPDVAALVDGLTKLVTIQFEDKEEQHIENLRKMFLAMSKDVRVIFIKLCDRLHNMRTLEAKPDDKRRMTALETMHVYAPLAHRLGMQRIKQQLENLALAYLDPIGYREISDDIERRHDLNKDFLERVREQIHDRLTESGLEFLLSGRVKSVYSIYRKMYEQNKSFEEIYDFYALRVLVNTERECYEVLGIIHDMFKMMPGRFKDYISNPKPNMYKSLHTTVMGRGGIPFEVQIRTHAMHKIAEYGVAAHWKYKSGEESPDDLDNKLAWIAKLIETEDGTRDPDEFMQALKIDIFHDETFVFTPKGDIITLPQGATVIDFAYNIHSEIGNKMVGAKVNGMIVPIDRVLQTGEIVEIITSRSSRGPSRDWLKIVCTGEARTKIRSWFKREKRAENIIIGKAEFDRQVRKIWPQCNEAQRSEAALNVSQRFGFSEPDDMFGAIGYGGISLHKLNPKLTEELERLAKAAGTTTSQPGDQQQSDQKPRRHRSTGGVIIDGVEGCQVKFARCCNPVPGDSIVGFVTQGYGVSIHRIDCKNVRMSMSNPEHQDRWLRAVWDSDPNEKSGRAGAFEAALTITAIDSVRLISDITYALADMRVEVIQLNKNKNGTSEVDVHLNISCRSVEHVNSIISRLRGIRDVNRVVRSGYVD